MPGTAAKTAGRFSQFAVAAAKMAMADSGLDPATMDRTAISVSFGTSMGGVVDVIEPNIESFLYGGEIAPSTVLEYPAHTAASRVAIVVGSQGHTNTVSTGCTSGLEAISWAADKIVSGDAAVAIAGGTDTPLSAATIEAFRATGALSRWNGEPAEASRPFDRLRSGLVLAEGAAAVIVEEESAAWARGASVYARISGSATFTEAHDLRRIDLSGQSIARVMALALREAELEAHALDYICGHGSSLVDYDAAESAGVRTALGKHARSCPISSIKSMCGQPLGAAGALQVVASCLALRHQTIPPTINYSFPDPACDLDYVPNRARVARLRHVLVNAKGLGGSHTCVVLSTVP
jgi:3-oxoacyl-(acyl-carrier-protein) synthase